MFSGKTSVSADYILVVFATYSVNGFKCMEELYKQQCYLVSFSMYSFDDSTESENRGCCWALKTDLIFIYNFLDSKSDVYEVQAIINLWSCSNKNCAFVFLIDPDVTFRGQKRGCSHLSIHIYTYIYIYIYIMNKALRIYTRHCVPYLIFPQ